jgi:2-aminoethylphosphonate-pyruvate transaminase
MRIMVDMSATLLHHGHVRLLRRAKDYGTVVVGLTADDEVLRRKGYRPELPFDARKEILESIRYVDEVVETPWLITLGVLEAHNIDALLHGSDNVNDVPSEQLMVVPRTPGISSSDLRKRSIASIVDKSRKAVFSTDHGSLLAENILGLEPCCGRGDPGYQMLEERVLARLRQMTGHERIVALPGSASLALEVAVQNFVVGRTLVVATGEYAGRFISYCQAARRRGNISSLEVVPIDGMADASGRYDWLVAVSTESRIGYKKDIRMLRSLADRIGAQLLVDATGSVGLEDGHELADVIGYSSCNGLFGLTGSSFIAYNKEPVACDSSSYLNLATHAGRQVTGPYHAICSLDQVLPRHHDIRESVMIGKRVFCHRYADRLVHSPDSQPLLCTLVRGIVRGVDENVIVYQAPAAMPGTSVVCHLGEGHLGNGASGAIYDRITIDD